MSVDTIEGLRKVLGSARTIAVVGLSAEWHRPSYFAAKYMQSHGYRIIPVNPKYPEILGERAFKSLLEIPEDLAKTIDMVDCFRKTEDILPIAQQAIQIRAKFFWQQLGVLNHEAVALVESAGLTSVIDRCLKIEHARIFGGLNFVGVNTKVISAKRPQLTVKR
jgi:uncharacterized protein